MLEIYMKCNEARIRINILILTANGTFEYVHTYIYARISGQCSNIRTNQRRGSEKDIEGAIDIAGRMKTL